MTGPRPATTDAVPGHGAPAERGGAAAVALERGAARHDALVRVGVERGVVRRAVVQHVRAQRVGIGIRGVQPHSIPRWLRASSPSISVVCDKRGKTVDNSFSYGRV